MKRKILSSQNSQRKKVIKSVEKVEATDMWAKLTTLAAFKQEDDFHISDISSSDYTCGSDGDFCKNGKY